MCALLYYFVCNNIYRLLVIFYINTRKYLQAGSYGSNLLKFKLDGHITQHQMNYKIYVLDSKLLTSLYTSIHILTAS